LSLKVERESMVSNWGEYPWESDKALDFASLELQHLFEKLAISLRTDVRGEVIESEIDCVRASCDMIVRLHRYFDKGRLAHELPRAISVAEDVLARDILNEVPTGYLSTTLEKLRELERSWREIVEVE
jgi:hypothetical protein